MKKLTVIAMALLLNTTVYAAVPDGVTDYSDSYYAIDNALDIDAADNKTVIIMKVDSTDDAEFEDSDIIYVDYEASGLESASGFMLKNNLDEGLYKVILDNKTSYFEIGTVIKTTDIAMTGNDIAEYSDADGNKVYKKGFLATVSADDYFNCNSVKLVYNQVIGAWSLTDSEPSHETQISGEGEVVLGVQINNIPDKATADNLSLYLSDDGVKLKEGIE